MEKSFHKKLIENGFVVSTQNIYKCKYCSIEIGSWNTYDDPDIVHKKLSINCKKYISDYKDINLRKKSFESSWTKSEINVNRLAEANFFYTGNGDIVKCWKCEKSFTDWKSDDDPFKLHPNCNIKSYETDEEINERFTCTICMQNIKNVLFLPCKHFSCCLNCSCKLLKCPMCNTIIEEKLTIFF